MVLGDAVAKLETLTFVWILSHVSRSITWSLLTLKASYVVQWSILTWFVMWGCQFIDWLKFETRPSSLLNFGTANLYFRGPVSRSAQATNWIASWISRTNSVQLRILLPRISRKVLPHGRTIWRVSSCCIIIFFVLDLLLCSIAKNFYSLFVCITGP